MPPPPLRCPSLKPIANDPGPEFAERVRRSHPRPRPAEHAQRPLTPSVRGGREEDGPARGPSAPRPRTLPRGPEPGAGRPVPDNKGASRAPLPPPPHAPAPGGQLGRRVVLAGPAAAGRVVLGGGRAPAPRLPTLPTGAPPLPTSAPPPLTNGPRREAPRRPPAPGPRAPRRRGRCRRLPLGDAERARPPPSLPQSAGRPGGCSRGAPPSREPVTRTAGRRPG
ncbi:basic proline-rich protein-like [Ochotona curzoniae]|uniref:basic proline-rich protein-like n=1 Tax=Ochotona curzoniae TaxID=130825 RepID=UPI001B350485|nr:basic proline-rich protein-like [Ochotona curzoniae]